MTSAAPPAQRIATGVRRRSRRRDSGLIRTVTSLRGLLPLLAGLGIWQLLGDPDSITFPPPSTWFSALRVLYEDGTLIPAVRTTLATAIIGLAVATVLGALLGIAIGGSRRLDRALAPFMDFFRTLPPPVLVPVVALLFGPTMSMGVTVVVLAIIWPVLLSTVAGMHAVPQVRLEMARTMGLTRVERFRKVVLPSLTPSVMLGVKISASLALLMTLLVDILGTGNGVGRVLLVSQQTFVGAGVWGLLLLIGTLGYLFSEAVAVIERRTLRNRPEGIRS